MEATKVDDIECKHCGCGCNSCVRVIYTGPPAVTASKCVARSAVNNSLFHSSGRSARISSPLSMRTGKRNHSLRLFMCLYAATLFTVINFAIIIKMVGGWGVVARGCTVPDKKAYNDYQILLKGFLIVNTRSWCLRLDKSFHLTPLSDEAVFVDHNV